MNGYPVVCGWPGCKGAKMLRWLESYRHEARRYRAARPRHCHRKGSCRACFENAPTSTVLSVGTVKLSTVVTDECRADAWKTPRHLLEHGYNANAKACPAARRTCASIPTTPTPPTVAHETCIRVWKNVQNPSQDTPTLPTLTKEMGKRSTSGLYQSLVENI